MVDPAEHLLDLEQALDWRRRLKEQHLRLVVTNGCFDLLHRGHASYLGAARNLGDALLVLINSDASVRRLKGDGRPIVSEEDRAFMLNSLKAVDRVMIFSGTDCADELAAIAPDIYVKAGDYTLDKLNAAERAALERVGAEIVFMPFVADRSTTGTIAKILAAYRK